jgi:hypothetical protein
MNDMDRNKALYERILEHVCSDTFKKNLQYVYTPKPLCIEMVGKLAEATTLTGKYILTFNLEFIEVLLYYYDVKRENIGFITDCKEKAEFLNDDRYKGVNIFIEKNYGEPEKWETNMKFDVIVGNPPYQTKSENSDTKTQPIWDKFVKKSLEILADNGYLCFIHPSGWRSNGNIFKDAKVLREKQLEYLELHSYADGSKTFGAGIGYDWYILKNCPYENATIICGQNGETAEINLKEKLFIPNFDFKKIFSLLAKSGEDTVEILYSRSAYGSDKDWVSEKKTKKNKYPIVYSTPLVGPTIWYASTKDNGHFEVSKIILNASRPLGFVIDAEGEYGMSQFCVGIVGSKEYLKMVASVIKNQKTNGFAEFMEACHFTDKIFNKDVISLLRKDFWKEFIK